VERREGEGCWRGGGSWAAVATWAREKKKRGRERFWAFGPKIERESSSFFCFPFLLKQTYFKTFSKPSLNLFLIFSQNHSSQ